MNDLKASDKELFDFVEESELDDIVEEKIEENEELDEVSSDIFNSGGKGNVFSRILRLFHK